MLKDTIELDSLDSPLSQSSVSLRLAEIQLKCSELLNDDSSLELTLEEPVLPDDGFNPYDRG